MASYSTPAEARIPLQNGTTLVEVIASGVILALTFLAIVTMFKVSRSLENTRVETYQARIIAHSILEEDQFRYSNFSALVDGETNRSTAEDVIYTFEEEYINPSHIKVFIESGLTSQEAWSDRQLAYKRIRVQVDWGSETVQLVKWVTQL